MALDRFWRFLGFIVALSLVFGAIGAVIFLFILAIRHGSTLGAALLATTATIGGSALVGIFDRRRVMDGVRRHEIGSLYLEFASVLAGQEMTARKREKVILDFQKKCLLYSSAGTLKKFRAWHRGLPGRPDGDWSDQETVENNLRYEAFIKAMRRDLGISNWNLQDGDLARTVLSDYDEIQARATAHLELAKAA
ncbi:MAG: hypothetical protein ABW065_13700 [Solirubrobacterales bacterium]